jgi:SAM-dependent methyltransferase
MAEITDSEIDVEQLMAEIRAAVAKREAEGQRSLINVSLELYNLLSTAVETPSEPAELSTLDFQPKQYAPLPQLRLQPEFVPREDDHYHVSDLLQYHDHTFIWNAYRAILKREPDEEGLKQFLKKLRGGRFNKIDVLASLRFSQEGRSRNVTVDGLARPAMIRRFYRVPVLGYLLELIVGIARLPAFLRSQREFEAHALAQQQLIASHLNNVSHTGFQVTESLSRELAEVSDRLSKGQKDLMESSTRELKQVSTEQRKFAELQHQQIVLLFREQREIIERLKNVKDELEARLMQLDAPSKTGAERQRASAEGQALSDKKRRGLNELFALFPEQFRGKREEVKEGLKFYLPFLKSAKITDGILDLGCGRGEWLELLREEGLKGRGVEINHILIEQARRSGLEVVEERALSYLRGVPDQSLNAVTGFHFIEHLSFEMLIELLDEITRTLKPNGLVIFETPNPKNLVVGACNFYSDPTHLVPLFPDTIQFIMSNRGFTDIRVEYLNPVGGSPFDDGSERSQALNSWLYGPRDFALIGRRA